MRNKSIYFILMILLCFTLFFGCENIDIKNGKSKRDVLNYLQQKYGREFICENSKQNIKEIEIENKNKKTKQLEKTRIKYYEKTFTVTETENRFSFEVKCKFNKKSQSFVLKDNYTEELFYYYLKNTKLNVDKVDYESGANIVIHFKDENGIKDVLARTLAVTRKTLEDSSYKKSTSNERYVFKGISFVCDDYNKEFNCPGYFSYCNLILKGGDVVKSNTIYTFSYNRYDGKGRAYIDEQERDIVDIDDIETYLYDIVMKEYRKYKNDYPIIKEARQEVLEYLKREKKEVKELDFSGITWKDNWNGEDIYFNGNKEKDESYISVSVSKEGSKWIPKIKYER